MSGPKRIYLQPECCADPGTGQMWCEDDQTDLEKCSEPWTEYVRADTVAAQVAAAPVEPTKPIPDRYKSHTPAQALGHLIEECGEVLAAAGKTVRFGWRSYNPEIPEAERETNEDWLMREIADLERAIAALKSSIAAAMIAERARQPDEAPR